jgi:excisionase family DNA binding protein
MLSFSSSPSSFSTDDQHSDTPAARGPAPTPKRSASPPASESTPRPEPDEARWLSIDAACKLLGVDQSTLRRWSDNGKIPVFRTPGGHRRYAEDDLRAFLRGEQRTATRRRVSRSLLTSMSMSAYEHDYLRQAHTQPWYRAYDQQTLDDMRPLGRRLVDLTIRYISSRVERDEIMTESRGIGREYGHFSARVGLSTADALEAFLFFRTPVIQAVTHYIEDENVSTRRAARITSELTFFMDQVLIATIAAHDERVTGDG